MTTPTPPPVIESPDIVASGVIDQRFTTPALEYHSTGTFLVWSSGARADKNADVAPDLFGCEPGGPVSVLYDNPHRDSRLELAGGDGGRIVFVEDNVRVFGEGHWKMWYLAKPGAPALLIDEGAGKLPFFDVSGSRLVWTLMTGRPTESQLWLLDLDTMERRLLLAAEAAITQYWFPAIDGNRVVYGALELTADGSGEERHVYLLDLDVDGTPRRLDTSGKASEPDIQGDTVVWKESRPDLHFINRGSLVRYSLRSGEADPIIMDPSRPQYGAPQVGNRYISADSGNTAAVYLAEIATAKPVRIMDLGPIDADEQDAVVRPDLTGDLLAYIFGPAGGDLELRWMILR